MSKHSQDPFAVGAWLPEASTVTRRPSWIARRLSTRPPAPHVPSPPPPAPPQPAAEEAPAESAVMETAQMAPIVDTSASIAIAQLSEENAALREQVAEMASAMARLRRQVLEASERELVRLALVIAERVVGRELATRPDLLVEWAREAIDSLAAKDEVVIAVARDVGQRMPESRWEGVGVEHRLQIDPQLEAGGVEVRSPEGTVPTSAEARLTAVAQALGVGDP